MPRIPRQARQSTGRPHRIGETPVPAPAAGERRRRWQCCWTLPELSAFSMERPPGCALFLDADHCKEETGRSALDLVGEDAQGELLETRLAGVTGAIADLVKLLDASGAK